LSQTPKKSHTQTERTPAGNYRGQQLVLGLSALIWLACVLCYALQPDLLAGVTVWPRWLGLIPGVFLALLGFRPRRLRPFFLTLGLWLFYLIFFVEETFSLLRFGAWPDPAWEAARKQGQAIRVITLNCRMASKRAAAEVVAYQPDIVLFQERPDRRSLELLAEELYGPEAGLLTGYDVAILARGRLTPTPPTPASARHRYAQARVQLPSGQELEVGSIHLASPRLKKKLWSRDYWAHYRWFSRIHRDELDAIRTAMEQTPPDVPLIVGGDFNTPARDRLFARMPARLRDAFAEAGRGWGSTYPAKLPGIRIDQVWISPPLRAVSVVTHTVKHSDHRMVVSDLLLK
jgi:endonuclease/exonuclease/phosphatase (EEP) superfamily protein YafD